MRVQETGATSAKRLASWILAGLENSQMREDPRCHLRPADLEFSLKRAPATWKFLARSALPLCDFFCGDALGLALVGKFAGKCGNPRRAWWYFIRELIVKGSPSVAFASLLGISKEWVEEMDKASSSGVAARTIAFQLERSRRIGFIPEVDFPKPTISQPSLRS